MWVIASIIVVCIIIGSVGIVMQRNDTHGEEQIEVNRRTSQTSYDSSKPTIPESRVGNAIQIIGIFQITLSLLVGIVLIFAEQVIWGLLFLLGGTIVGVFILGLSAIIINVFEINTRLRQNGYEMREE